jgi:hypothetical protein
MDEFDSEKTSVLPDGQPRPNPSAGLSAPAPLFMGTLAGKKTFLRAASIGGALVLLIVLLG